MEAGARSASLSETTHDILRHSHPLTNFSRLILPSSTTGTPVKEFKPTEKLTCDALSTRALALSFPNEQQDPEEFNIELRYHSEGTNQDLFVDFDDDESLEFAIQGSKGEGYVLFSASVVKKGAVAAPQVVAAPSPVRSSSAPKAVKKSNTAKHRTLPRSKAEKLSVNEKIIAALKEFAAIGIDDLPLKMVAMRSGYTNVDSASFKKALKQVKADGLVESPSSETLRLSEAGKATLGTVDAPTSNRQVQERMKNVLTGKAPQILDILADGRAHNRKDVAEAVGYTNDASKSFKDPVDKMESLCILEKTKDQAGLKMLQLTDVAFPFGRGAGRGAAAAAAVDIGARSIDSAGSVSGDDPVVSNASSDDEAVPQKVFSLASGGTVPIDGFGYV